MRGTKITLLDGKERVLRYDLNAIAEIGERLDIKVRLSHIQEDLLDRPLPLGAVRTLLFCGLMHDKEANPETEEEIGALVDLQSLPEVITGFFSRLAVISPESAAGERLTLMQEVLEERAAEKSAAMTG